MKGDFHVRIRENVGVQFPCVTRLCVILNSLHAEIYNYNNHFLSFAASFRTDEKHCKMLAMETQRRT